MIKINHSAMSTCSLNALLDGPSVFIPLLEEKNQVYVLDLKADF